MPDASTGLLIMRAWLEPGSSKPLRVRIGRTSDVALGLQHDEYYADVAEVLTTVQRWLDDFSTN